MSKNDDWNVNKLAEQNQNPDVCPREMAEIFKILKKIQEKYEIGDEEIREYIGLWFKNDLKKSQILQNMKNIKNGAEIKRMVESRTLAEGKEKTGIIWNYLPCLEAYNVVKANKKGGRRKRTKKRRRKRNLKKRTKRRRRKRRKKRRRTRRQSQVVPE